MLKTLLLHITYRYLKIINKLLNKKTGNVIYFQPKSICQFIRIHMIFFLIFDNPVYRKMFESYLESLRSIIIQKLLQCSA